MTGLMGRGGRLKREVIFDLLWSRSHRTWDAKYDDDARSLLRFAIGRVAGVMAQDQILDCQLMFERVPLSSIVFGRADAPSRDAPDGGYPALRATLLESPDVDSVPVCGACLIGGPGYVIWDGRHRYKTYLAAGRTDIPSWSAKFSTGTGTLLVPLVDVPVPETGRSSVP